MLSMNESIKKAAVDEGKDAIAEAIRAHVLKYHTKKAAKPDVEKSVEVNEPINGVSERE